MVPWPPSSKRLRPYFQMLRQARLCAVLMWAWWCVASTRAVHGQLLVPPDEWEVPEDETGPLPGRTAVVGDNITFVWSGYHNVFIHPSGDCTDDGAIEVGENTGAEYVFTADDVGDVLFVCDIGTHCERGMQLTVTVTDADGGGGDVSGNATMGPAAATASPAAAPSPDSSTAPAPRTNTPMAAPSTTDNSFSGGGGSPATIPAVIIGGLTILMHVLP